MKNKKTKVSIPKLVVFILFVVVTVVSLIFSSFIYGEESVFYTVTVSNNAFIQGAYMKIPALILTVQYIAIAIAANFILAFVMNKIVSKTKREITVAKLLNSCIKWIIVIFTILLILGSWGVDTTTLIASAGILSLVVGLGAQSLVADIIAGLFIVVEGEYQVGDIVIIDDWRGTVTEIGIRTTKIEDAGGNIKIVNNSEIKSIINQTQALSVAKAIVGVEYGESLQKTELIISDNLENIKNNIPAIVEGPFYKGVDSFSTSGINLLFLAKCNEEDIYQVQRDLNREIKLMFDRNNINMALPQIVVNQPSEKSLRTTKRSENGAREFVEEQKDLGKNVEEEE